MIMNALTCRYFVLQIIVQEDLEQLPVQNENDHEEFSISFLGRINKRHFVYQ